MNDFRNGAEFQALMVSLGRVEDVYLNAIKAARDSEIKPQGHHERAHLQKVNKLLGRQLRAALLCSAFSIAEAAIIGLTKHKETKVSDVKNHFKLDGKYRPTQLHRSQFILQNVLGFCKTAQWDEDWEDLHQLRKLRNKLIHSGGLDEEDKLSKVVDDNDGFSAWIEPMFEGSEAEIYVLVVGEMYFMQTLKKLHKFIDNIDEEFSRTATG